MGDPLVRQACEALDPARRLDLVQNLHATLGTPLPSVVRARAALGDGGAAPREHRRLLAHSPRSRHRVPPSTRSRIRPRNEGSKGRTPPCYPAARADKVVLVSVGAVLSTFGDDRRTPHLRAADHSGQLGGIVDHRWPRRADFLELHPHTGHRGHSLRGEPAARLVSPRAARVQESCRARLQVRMALEQPPRRASPPRGYGSAQSVARL